MRISPQTPLLLALVGCACSPGDAGDASAHGDTQGDGGLTEEADVNEPEMDAEADTAGSVGGPLTLVATETYVSTERVCDHDGDGLLDNAVADLGNPGAELFALMLSTALSRGIDAGYKRPLLHIPWVDDLAGPTDGDVRLATFDGVDTDDPENPEDDFSGEEPFYVEGDEVDACAEPRFLFRGAHLDDGQLIAETSVGPAMVNDIPAHGVAFLGNIAPWGLSAEAQQCAYTIISELGGDVVAEADATLLELLLAGGAAAGMPHVAGLTPDLDLDGDGFERFVLDEDWHITSCIDGDNTIIDGRDCWLDPRLADGFSLVFGLTAIAATLAGTAPDWELHAQGTCGGYHRCTLGCVGNHLCVCNPPCPACEPHLSLLEDCMAENCEADCGSDFQFTDCKGCINRQCAEELAANDAVDCCSEPPEPSFWDEY